MKARSSLKRLFTATWVAVHVMVYLPASIAQDKSTTDLKPFKITIEATENGIQMQSHQGSAWLDLSFSLAENKPQAINVYGMTETEKLSAGKDPKLADYVFTVTRTKEGITLKGWEGTAWKELSFSLQKNDRQTIDQYGMTD